VYVPYSLDSGLALVKLRTKLDVGKRGLKIHNSRGAHDLLPAVSSMPSQKGLNDGHAGVDP
jgi:hypothetical protein